MEMGRNNPNKWISLKRTATLISFFFLHPNREEVNIVVIAPKIIWLITFRVERCCVRKWNYGDGFRALKTHFGMHT